VNNRGIFRGKKGKEREGGTKRRKCTGRYGGRAFRRFEQMGSCRKEKRHEKKRTEQKTLIVSVKKGTATGLERGGREPIDGELLQDRMDDEP